VFIRYPSISIKEQSIGWEEEIFKLRVELFV
jgi:hypothetical protein